MLQAEDVVFRSGNRGVFDTSAHSGSLTLTNERIIFSYSVGLIKKTEETIEIDLEDIKIFEGVLQLRPTVRKEKVGYVSLVAYLNNKEYEFEFLQKHKKKMLLFANEANKVVTGVCGCWSVEDVGGKSISKTLRGAIGTAAPVICDWCNWDTGSCSWCGYEQNRGCSYLRSAGCCYKRRCKQAVFGEPPLFG